MGVRHSGDYLTDNEAGMNRMEVFMKTDHIVCTISELAESLTDETIGAIIEDFTNWAQSVVALKYFQESEPVVKSFMWSEDRNPYREEHEQNKD